MFRFLVMAPTVLLLFACGSVTSAESSDNSAPYQPAEVPRDHDLVVFFEAEAPRESIDAVEQMLLDDPDVEDIWFVWDVGRGQVMGPR